MAAQPHGWSCWGRGAVPFPVRVGPTVRASRLPIALLNIHQQHHKLTVTLRLGVGSFQQYYEVGPLREYSSSTIAWIPSLQLFCLFAMGPVVGVLYDNYGPRPLIVGGTLLHVFGLMMASLATKYYQFILSQGVCSAVGVACIYQPGKFDRYCTVLSVFH